MAPIACLTHWYESLLYVVPVLAVGGWGWWSSRRVARRRNGGGGPPAPPVAPSPGAGAHSARERIPA